MKQTFKIFLAGISLFVLMSSLGCGRVSVMAQFAGTYLNWKIDDYLDVTRTQKKSFKEAVSQALEDVKAKTLPLVSAHLKELADRLERQFPTNQAEAKLILENEKELFDKTFQQMQTTVWPRFEHAFETLDFKNWEAFKEEFEKQNKKILKKKENCEDRFEEQLEAWIGNAEKNQKAFIKEYCQKADWNEELQVENRRNLFAQFEKKLDVTKESFSGQKIWAHLKAWLNEMPTLGTPQFQIMRDRRTIALTDSMQKMLLSLTLQQRKTLIDNIRMRADEIRKLEPKKSL